MRDPLASHYAGAFAEAVFAPDSGLSRADAGAQLADAADLVANSKPLQLALLSPAVSKSRKKAIIARLADDLGLHHLVRNFLLVVISHRRIGELRAIQKNFELIADERTGWIPADIASAKALTPPQREEIERVLGHRLGKYIRAHYIVDPALIAGVRARVASKEYDASLRGKLEDMRQRLAARL